MSVLVFDSGVGGLSIFRELRMMLPGKRFIYVGDDAGFPYGDWDEVSLTNRIVGIFDHLLNLFQPQLAIVACNTASTLILPALREEFETPFVGTVPAIKPAAERTASGLVTLLGTPGTISRDYTKNLIRQYASDIEVNLVGASGLAQMAEDYLLQRPFDEVLLRSEIAPCFVQRDQRRTDIVIMGCTHYPFLANQMRQLAPWPVDWIDPAEAIARRALKLLGDVAPSAVEIECDIAIVTSATPELNAARLMKTFGLESRAMPELLLSRTCSL